ncbi:T9SS type A sorting domain-containing protein [Bacteroidota bacterium]
MCPVDLAWGLSYSLDSNISLWQGDNGQPTLEGSYLATCVFYAKIFNESPVGIQFTAGLDTSVALFLQNVAQETVTSIRGNSNGSTPESIHLYQNYPNLFNPVTTIRYYLQKNGYVSLKVYNALGKEIIELINDFQNAGSYEVEFDAGELSSGNYYCKLMIGDKSISKKMTLVK